MTREQHVSLRPTTREDVSRIRQWLEDEEVSERWFGRYSYGDPAHQGYHPSEMEGASEEEWKRVFDNPEHRILSIYTSEDEHIGEVHIAIEESLGDGQLSILVGRKDMWHLGYGTAGTESALELAFGRLRSVPSVGGHSGIQHCSDGDVHAPRLRPRGHTA